MPVRNPQYNRAKPVFDGADTGAYTLPADLLGYRDAVTRLRAEMVAANERAEAANPGGVRSGMARNLTVMARKGALPLGWVDSLRAAQDAQAKATTEAMLLDEALGYAESAVIRAMGDYSNEVIDTHLRPVLLDIVAKVRRAMDGVTDVPWTEPRLIARAPKRVRDALVVVEEQQVRYEAIRRAESAIQLVTEDVDSDAWHIHEIKNLPDLWPMQNWRNNANVPPWPKDALARLAWVCSKDVEVWMPTSAECQDAWARWMRQSATPYQPRLGDTPAVLRSNG